MVHQCFYKNWIPVSILMTPSSIQQDNRHFP